MIEITVCVGSSCHTKGAYKVVQRFKNIIGDRGLENQILLKGSFCLGKCGLGTSVKIGENFYVSIEPEDVEQLIEKIINDSFKGEIK